MPFFLPFPALIHKQSVPAGIKRDIRVFAIVTIADPRASLEKGTIVIVANHTDVISFFKRFPELGPHRIAETLANHSQ